MVAHRISLHTALYMLSGERLGGGTIDRGNKPNGFKPPESTYATIRPLEFAAANEATANSLVGM